MFNIQEIFNSAYKYIENSYTTYQSVAKPTAQEIKLINGIKDAVLRSKNVTNPNLNDFDTLVNSIRLVSNSVEEPSGFLYMSKSPTNLSLKSISCRDGLLDSLKKLKESYIEKEREEKKREDEKHNEQINKEQMANSQKQNDQFSELASELKRVRVSQERTEQEVKRISEDNRKIRDAGASLIQILEKLHLHYLPEPDQKMLSQGATQYCSQTGLHAPKLLTASEKQNGISPEIYQNFKNIPADDEKKKKWLQDSPINRRIYDQSKTHYVISPAIFMLLNQLAEKYDKLKLNQNNNNSSSFFVDSQSSEICKVLNNAISQLILKSINENNLPTSSTSWNEMIDSFNLNQGSVFSDSEYKELKAIGSKFGLEQPEFISTNFDNSQRTISISKIDRCALFMKIIGEGNWLPKNLDFNSELSKIYIKFQQEQQNLTTGVDNAPVFQK